MRQHAIVGLREPRQQLDFLRRQPDLLAGEREAAAVGGPAGIAAFGVAFTRKDWSRAREYLADDFLLRDHRPLGLGALDRDQWIESLRVIDDLSSSWGGQMVRIIHWNHHGRFDVSRMLGTTLNDAGPFENLFVRVLVTDGDRIRSNDIFDVADADRALARFDELCADRP